MNARLLRPLAPSLLILLLLGASAAPLHAQKSNVDRETSGDAPADPGPLATGLSPKLDKRSIEAAMRKVADWQIDYAEPKFNQLWTYAALYDGLLATTQATGDAKYADAVERAAADKWHWKLLDDRFPHADDEALGQSYLDLNRRKPDPVRTADTIATMDRLVARPDDPKKPVWWWCDALFMAPPTLARAYALTGDRKYLDYMDREWAITTAQLYSPKDHLFLRDARFLTQHEKNGEFIYWARGNGWVLGGLARVIPLLPKDSPSRAKYIAQFRDMASKIASLQQPDGLWRTGLLDQQAYSASEVSGSAFFTYGMAWGINEGLLDRKTFQPVVSRAWAGMLTHIYASGRLGAIQPVGFAPDTFTPSASYVYGVGGFLLAGSELDRMVTKRK